ncbi:MAG: hypothetical protein AMXMBFR34_47040 [Myxococcaceae bacterium]
MDPRFLVDARGALTPADGQSPLSGRSGYFRLQNTSPDWAVFLRSPAQGGVQETRPRVVLTGDANGFPLQDLIAFLGQSRWSGVLRVAMPGVERSLLLKDGEVRSAASDSVADRIGEVMVRLGYVTRGHLEAVLNEAPPSRLGKVMVERNLIKAHDLYKCLHEQISEIFHGMMLAKEGTFALIDQTVEDKALTHNLSLSMQGLLMDSIRKIDELAQFRKKIPHGRMYVLKKRASDGTLEPEEESVLKQVDGRRTVLEVGQSAKVSEFDATRITYRLIEGGFVSLSQQPAEAAPPPAPSAPSTPGVPVTAAPPPPGGIDAARVVQIFNAIFREVRNEVAQRGNLDAFIVSANAALKGNGVSASPVLTGLAFTGDGSLPEPQVLAKFAALASQGLMGSEPIMSLRQALSDVMFFLLFQAGELLESAADEDLARRVKDMLAPLDAR